MRFASASSAAGSLEARLDEAIRASRADLGGLDAHLAVLFITVDHVPHAADIARHLKRALPGAVVLGCTAAGVVGGGAEIEERPAISLFLAHLPDVELVPFHLGRTLVGDPSGLDFAGVQRVVGEGDPSPMLLLADPFSCDSESLLRLLDQLNPGAVKVGGLASGAPSPGRNVLFWGDRVVTDGAVGVVLRGDVVVDAVVAQGCRPVGRPMTVTESADNLLFALDGEPALDVVGALLSSLDGESKRLFQRSPMLGIAMDPEVGALRRGDFLLRHVIGVDPPRKGVAIGHRLMVGDRVQFHVRDPAASAEDLSEQVTRYLGSVGEQPAGALMFSCVGRGQRFYGRPNHDTDLLAGLLEAPTTGFFCNGELGPVHGRSFLHGYTCALALFRQPAWN